MIEFIPGKKYQDRKGNVYTFIHCFGSNSYLSYNYCFEDKDGKALWRDKFGALWTARVSEFDIVAEYKEPQYSYLPVLTDAMNGQFLRRSSFEKALAQVADFHQASPHFKVLRINIDTGESSYVTKD